MKTSLCWLVVAIALAIAVSASPAWAIVYFSDDFNSYGSTAAVTAAGWSLTRTSTVISAPGNGDWALETVGIRHSSVGIDGTITTGKMLRSDTNVNRSPVNINHVDDGASYDATTRSFSTLGSAQTWLHMNVSAVLDHTGNTVFDIDVSADGGTTWNNAFRRISPGRGITSDTVTNEIATTLLPDHTNADGIVGPLDVNLSAWANNAASVKVRIRDFEPCDDYYIAIDDLKVDNVAPITGGNTMIFQENFDSGLGQMHRYGFADFPGYESAFKWNTDPFVDPAGGGNYHWGQYQPGIGITDLNRRGVLRIGHPAEVGTPVKFAHIDALYPGGGPTYDYLSTPLLDCTNMTEVFLGYEDEIFRYDQFNTDVLLMADTNDNGIPDEGDTMIKKVFNYYNNTDETVEQGEDQWYSKRLIPVPEAAGRDDVYFAWYYYCDSKPWWAIDSITVTGTNPNPTQPHMGDANNDGKVNDADATILASHWHVQSGAVWADGDFNADGKVDDKDASLLAVNWLWGVSEEGDATVPEPSTLVLVLSAVAMAWLGCRRR
jgi:hypothetical protein